MDPLSISKMSSGEKLEKIADAIENTGKEESVEEINEETALDESKSEGLLAEDFPAPETGDANETNLAATEKSSAKKI
jgi:hypothetical protein